MRLDAYLTEKKLAKSRERAKALIKSGGVLVNGKPVSKHSAEISDNDRLDVVGEDIKYVGRGGLKLEKAIEVFGISVQGKRCIDFGASTGGFTDCMLRNGAERVYAVDVGHDQLDSSLVNDPRVVNMEGTNIKNVSSEDFGEKADFLSCDVSFISLKLIIPKIAEVLSEKGEAAVLVKPQFECGRSDIGKNGIVRSEKVHIRVLREIQAAFDSRGMTADMLDYSPVCGGDGNIEYLVHAVHKSMGPPIRYSPEETVKKAFGILK